MLQTIEGIYRNGQIELSETPESISQAKVIVTFVEVQTVNGEQKSGLTAFDVAPDLLGKHDFGTGDLATNKEHLQGLGRD
ncbi:MAG: hypothetical protein LH614_21430 [Pyrinomonadaceae bacterium]|nr:hypothetical protein [Pyrinomonadaceae bacterium]